MTVATAVETPEQLEVEEAEHLCPEKALAHMLAHDRAIEALAHRG